MSKQIRMTKGRKKLFRPKGMVEVWDRKKGLVGVEDWGGGRLKRVRYKKSQKINDWERWKK